MNSNYRNALVAVALLRLARPASADVIALERPGASIHRQPRFTAPRRASWSMTQLAMFDAVDSIDRKTALWCSSRRRQPPPKRPRRRRPRQRCSPESIRAQDQVKPAPALSRRHAGQRRQSEGIKLGEAVAPKILEARANDVANAPDTYRPRPHLASVPPRPPQRQRWPTASARRL